MSFLMLLNLYGTQELDKLKEDPEGTGAAGLAAAPGQQVCREVTLGMIYNSSRCSCNDLRDVT